LLFAGPVVTVATVEKLAYFAKLKIVVAVDLAVLLA